MSIYDVNYKQIIRQLLPPDKRKSVLKSFLYALLSPVAWLRDLWLGDYRTGSTGLLWLNSTTYQDGERVTYKGSAYESLQNNNLNNNPTDVLFWMKVQENFIGVSERVLYNGDKLVFEYAINKYFGTTFRQPNNVSDIFISVFAKPITVFVVGGTEDNSSVVYRNVSSEFIIDDYSFVNYFNMVINVPATVFFALDVNPANCEKIIRNFADKYIIAGIRYTVQTY